MKHQETGAYFMLKIGAELVRIWLISKGYTGLTMEGGIPMAGRKPKPTALKKLEGNSEKRKLNTKELIPAKGMSSCPDWLLPEAKIEWENTDVMI